MTPLLTTLTTATIAAYFTIGMFYATATADEVPYGERHHDWLRMLHHLAVSVAWPWFMWKRR